MDLYFEVLASLRVVPEPGLSRLWGYGELGASPLAKAHKAPAMLMLSDQLAEAPGRVAQLA